MEIAVAQGGKFTFTIKSKELAQGLRPSKRNPRDNDFLVTCVGAIGRDGVLQAIDNLSRIDMSPITDGFPFPQIFVFTNTIIVCGMFDIYEWMETALHFELSIPANLAGSTWTALDFYDYIYLSNGDVVVIKNAQSNLYEISADLPHATCACNFNGQVIIGAPNVAGLGACMVLPVDPIELTVTQLGDIGTS